MRTNNSKTDEIIASLQPLFEEARSKKLWFHSNYQDLWFSPTELLEAQMQGKFIWSAENWQLRNPNEHILYLGAKKEAIEKEILAFTLRILK